MSEFGVDGLMRQTFAAFITSAPESCAKSWTSFLDGTRRAGLKGRKWSDDDFLELASFLVATRTWGLPFVGYYTLGRDDLGAARDGIRRRHRDTKHPLKPATHLWLMMAALTLHKALAGLALFLRLQFIEEIKVVFHTKTMTARHRERFALAITQIIFQMRAQWAQEAADNPLAAHMRSSLGDGYVPLTVSFATEGQERLVGLADVLAALAWRARQPDRQGALDAVGVIEQGMSNELLKRIMFFDESAALRGLLAHGGDWTAVQRRRKAASGLIVPVNPFVRRRGLWLPRPPFLRS